MGSKSFACFPNSDTTEGSMRGVRAAIVRTGVGVLLTEIEWPVEGERYTEPSCSRRKNAVGLGGVLAAACGVGASGGGGVRFPPTISTPNATHTSRSGARSNNWAHISAMVFTTDLQRNLFPWNTWVLFSVGSVSLKRNKRAHCPPGASQHIVEFYVKGKKDIYEATERRQGRSPHSPKDI